MTNTEMKQIAQKIEEEGFEFSNEIVSRTATEFYLRLSRINKHKMNPVELISLWKNVQGYLDELISLGVYEGSIVLDEIDRTPEQCIGVVEDAFEF